jgi:hypothetical protein
MAYQGRPRVRAGAVMSTCTSVQTTKSGTTLACVCDTDDPCHIHQTAGGVRFIGALDGVLVLGGGR